MSQSQGRPKVVIPVVAALVAGAFGGSLYVAFTFGGAAPTSNQTPTVTVHQAAATASAQPTATVTKVVTIKVAPKKTTQKVNALTAQDPQPTDPPATDATVAPDPILVGAPTAGTKTYTPPPSN